MAVGNRLEQTAGTIARDEVRVGTFAEQFREHITMAASGRLEKRGNARFAADVRGSALAEQMSYDPVVAVVGRPLQGRMAARSRA